MFPVKVPYTVTADISKYDGEIFNKFPSQKYIESKSIELEKMFNSLCGVVSGKENLITEMSKICGFNETTNIVDVAMQLEEDIAIMQNGEVVAICFCFPSGFIPTSKLGLSLFEVHRPVADGDKLRRASDGITTIMSKENAKFQRYVWTLTTNRGLSQHPLYERPEPKQIEDICFRTETQTTLGLGNGVSLFFVKVEMTPLENIWDENEKRIKIIDSVNSMSENVLDYKGLRKIKNIINKDLILSNH